MTNEITDASFTCLVPAPANVRSVLAPPHSVVVDDDLVERRLAGVEGLLNRRIESGVLQGCGGSNESVLPWPCRRDGAERSAVVRLPFVVVAHALGGILAPPAFAVANRQTVSHVLGALRVRLGFANYALQVVAVQLLHLHIPEAPELRRGLRRELLRRGLLRRGLFRRGLRRELRRHAAMRAHAGRVRDKREENGKQKAVAHAAAPIPRHPAQSRLWPTLKQLPRSHAHTSTARRFGNCRTRAYRQDQQESTLNFRC